MRQVFRYLIAIMGYAIAIPSVILCVFYLASSKGIEDSLTGEIILGSYIIIGLWLYLEFCVLYLSTKVLINQTLDNPKVRCLIYIGMLSGLMSGAWYLVLGKFHLMILFSTLIGILLIGYIRKCESSTTCASTAPSESAPAKTPKKED